MREAVEALLVQAEAELAAEEACGGGDPLELAALGARIQALSDVLAL